MDKEQRRVNIAMFPDFFDRGNPDREIAAILATDEFFADESLYVF